MSPAASATLGVSLHHLTGKWNLEAKIYMADFLRVPTDFWLSMYWLLLCGTLT